MDEERLKILQLIADGTITAEEGAALLDSLEAASDEETETNVEADTVVLVPKTGEILSPPIPLLDQSPPRPGWAKYWFYVLGLGAFLASLGFSYTVLIVAGQVYWVWIFLTLPALFSGGLLCLCGWLIRTSAWLHIQVENEGARLNLSLPLPLGWIAWLVRIARPFVPQLRELAADDLLETLVASATEEGFNIEVQEENGEHVLLYYGR
jgi:hypothetical protein